MTFKYSIVCVLLIAIVVAITCVFTATTVAEYSDIDSNAVVTFNQQVKNGNFATSDGWQSYNGSSFSISNFEVSIISTQFGGISQSGLHFYTHKYYLSVDSYGSSDSDTLSINISRNSDVTFDLTTSYQTYDTVLSISSFWSSYGNAIYIVTPIDSVVFLRNLYIIDLTLMFGSGNEPDLEECRSLFTSDYYLYSLGTPLTMNGVESYSKGYNDALSSYDYIVTSSFFSQTAYGIDFNSYRPAVTNQYNSDEFANALGFSGYMVLPFGQTLASYVVLECSLVVLDVDNRFTSLDVGILYGGQYLMLYSIDNPNDDPSNNTSVKFTITLPYASDGLVLFSNNSEGSSIQDYYSLVVSDINVSYRYYNPQNDINNIYNSGFANGRSEGLKVGYQNGYSDAINSSSNGDYSFTGLLSSVIEAPVNVLIGTYDNSTGSRVGGLFNFDFLGYSMSTFLMSLFSLALIICIARVFV